MSEKSFRVLAAYFIDGGKITQTATSLDLEHKTVRAIFAGIRKRLEENCWNRIKPFHGKIWNCDHPYKLLAPELKIKDTDIRKDTGLLRAGVTALIFRDGSVTTSSVRIRYDFKEFNYSEECGETDEADENDEDSDDLEQDDNQDENALNWIDYRIPEDYMKGDEGVFGYSFADLSFKPGKGFIKREYADEYRHINVLEDFWSFARVQTTQVNRWNFKKFCLHLKEIEWRFNNLTAEERKDLTKHFERVARGKKTKKPAETAAVKESQNTAVTLATDKKDDNSQAALIQKKLYLKLLELLRNNPL